VTPREPATGRARARTRPAAAKAPARTFSIHAGDPERLGAHWTGAGTTFAVYSSVASKVDLCLFVDGHEARVPLPMRTRHIWHGFVEGIGPGVEYGFRVHGPWQPEAGLRCNPNKLLLDPYARQVRGDDVPGTAPLPYVPGEGQQMSDEDSAGAVPRGVVVDEAFDWGGDRRPERAWTDTVIYEAHVKGFSQQHPDIPPELRGAYAALAHPASIDHFRAIGVTAIELLPVHAFVHDALLIGRGLRNYWGYNSIGFFAPHAAYASEAGRGDPVREFKTMVKGLHAAGLEVLLDVVYNHTAEGNHLGPMISMRGLDNQAYYRLVDGDPQHYMDYTGTGNSLNVRHPQTLRLILDSLRYWVTEMHVDGFRFDLAVTLGRANGHFDGWSSFFAAVQQDPVLRRVKLIAEPWDLGDEGYRLGGFAIDWSEWNGRYRDTVRDFWRSQHELLPDLAARLTASADVFAGSGRAPHASVNFVVAHDGFTLRDLVSYNDKHNEANGENNQDGEAPGRSWNLGVEGPTDDPAVNAKRARQVRNFLATLLVSQGTPMIAHGDELGRTQNGNNNAYCQDDAITWIDWARRDRDLEAFVAAMTRVRTEHHVLRATRWVVGEPHDDAPAPVARWYHPAGHDMRPEDWDHPEAASLTLRLDPSNPSEPSLCLLFCAALEPVDFVLPDAHGRRWRALIDTDRETPSDDKIFAGGATTTRRDLSFLLLVADR
jgi:glycogen operon protein